MIEELLKKNGVDYESIPHELAYTAQETAAIEHVTGYEFAKTVVVTDEENFYLCVLPAPYQVDLEKLSELIGKELRLAEEKETKPLFPECEIGAEPPFGSAFHLPTYVDESLASHDEIVFRGGTHEKTIKMDYQDYLQLEDPVVASFRTGDKP